MKKYLIESIKIINSNLIFIFILAFIGMYIFSGAMILLAIFSILSLIIMPVIYGHFTEIITGEHRVSFVQIFKNHWSNFYIVLLILGAPVFIFVFFFKGLLTWKAEIVTKFAIAMIINVLTIYVFPLVFLIRENFVTIPLGVKYLLNNFKYSLPLVLLTLLIFIIKPLSTIFAILFLRDNFNLFMLAILGFVCNFLVCFISLTIFITASMILIKESALKEKFKR